MGTAGHVVPPVRCSHTRASSVSVSDGTSIYQKQTTENLKYLSQFNNVNASNKLWTSLLDSAEIIFGGEKDKNKKTFGTSNILFSESNFAICVAYRLNYR